MKLHVIVPAKNERLNVPYFFERARPVLDQLNVDWSIVFTNNASDDGTLEEMRKLRAIEPRVKIITLSRDFGYHAALLAGLSTIESDYYAIIDVDCEDPPELLPKFYEAIQQGAQLVYGIRSNRKEPALIAIGRKLFYVLNRRLADSDIVMWMGEFSMFTRQVRDALLIPKTTYLSVRAEMGYVGFAPVGIPYARAPRRFGETHYNLWRLFVFGIGSILSGTTFPLRLVFYLAALIAVGFPLTVWAARLSAGQAAILAAIIALYFLVIAVPLVSLYLARVYKNVVHRPLFVIDKAQSDL